MTKQELFVELADPNENGVSRWVEVSEFVGKYSELQFGNGGSWCRGSSALAKKYVLEVDKTATKGNAIDRIRLKGHNSTERFNHSIRKDIRNLYKSQNERSADQRRGNRQYNGQTIPRRMNYIGPKNKLSGFISSTVRGVAGEDLSGRVFCDMFAGTGAVGKTFKTGVQKVIANDCEYYSYALNRNYIGNHTEIAGAEAALKELSELPPAEGFIYRHYCRGGGTDRQYFSDLNGRKIDAIRTAIERWRGEEDLYFFLLASLIESADRVANTASVYGAYLKKLKPSAAKELTLQPAAFETNGHEHDVFNTVSAELIGRVEGDILYLDPPYNARQYGANYHLLNTIARYDDFVPRGKTGMREYRRSNWCSAARVADELEDLVRRARFRYVFLSYNNEGLMSPGAIRSIMERYGRYDLAQTEYPRFRADREENRNHKANTTQEFLHILEKR